MSKIRLLKGFLENKSVQTTIVKRGLKVAISGVLISSISATFIGCKSNKETATSDDNKTTVEEKVDKEEVNKEDKTEKKDEKKEEKKETKTEEKKEVASNETTNTSPVQNIAGRNNYIVENPATGAASTGQRNQSATVQGTVTVDKPAPKTEEVKPVVKEEPKLSTEVKEEEKPVVKEEEKPVEVTEPVVNPSTTEPKVTDPVEEKTEVKDEEIVKQTEEQEETKPVEEETEVKEEELDENGFTKDGYLTYDKDTTTNHMHLARGRYEEALVKKGYKSNSSLYRGSYRETLILPMHKDNGLNEVELKKITDVLDKYGSKEFALLINRNGVTKDTEMALHISFSPDKTDSDKDGYVDTLVKSTAYSESELASLEKYYRNVLKLKGYDTVDHVEAKQEIGTVKFKRNYDNARKEAEYNDIMNLLDRAKAENVSMKVENSDEETITLTFYGNTKKEENKEEVKQTTTPVVDTEKKEDVEKTTTTTETQPVVKEETKTEPVVKEETKTEPVVKEDTKVETESKTETKKETEVVATSTKPIIDCLDEVYLGLGEQLTIGKLQLKISSKNPKNLKYAAKPGNLNINKEGTYNISIYASDAKDSYSEKAVKVHVIDPKKKLNQDEEFAKQVNEKVLEYINQERVKAKLPELVLSEEINPYCDEDSERILKQLYFNYNDNKPHAEARMKQAGMKFAQSSEKAIFAIKGDVESTAAGLINFIKQYSDEYMGNILNKSFDKVGVGSFSYGNRTYCTIILTSPEQGAETTTKPVATETVKEEKPVVEKQEEAKADSTKPVATETKQDEKATTKPAETEKTTSDTSATQTQSSETTQKEEPVETTKTNTGTEEGFNRTGTAGAIVINPSELTEEQKANENYVKELNAEIFKLINEERAKKGIKALTTDERVVNYSTEKSLDMINHNYFDHKDKAGNTTLYYMQLGGITPQAWAENIAYTTKVDVKNTAKALVNLWMNSDGHRKNILNDTYDKTGVGVSFKDNTVYATQIFIK